MLRGETVGVRPITPEDVQTIQQWQGDPAIMGDHIPIYLTPPETLYNENANGSNWHIHVMYLLSDPKILVGEISYCRSWSRKNIEFGFYILPEHRRKKYCTQAINLLLDFVFLADDFRRVQAQTHIDNIPGRRLLEKIGFVNEGTMREFLFIRGKWVDTMLYSILRSEWKQPKYLKS